MNAGPLPEHPDWLWRLLPRSSFADYVARWLLDAMAEYTS
jgi:sarcosine oxidase gamma subunit